MDLSMMTYQFCNHSLFLAEMEYIEPYRQEKHIFKYENQMLLELVALTQAMGYIH